jgi:hypothetical protein
MVGTCTGCSVEPLNVAPVPVWVGTCTGCSGGMWVRGRGNPACASRGQRARSSATALAHASLNERADEDRSMVPAELCAGCCVMHKWEDVRRFATVCTHLQARGP